MCSVKSGTNIFFQLNLGFCENIGKFDKYLIDSHCVDYNTIFIYFIILSTFLLQVTC